MGGGLSARGQTCAENYPEHRGVRPDGATPEELYASHTALEIAEQYGVCLNTVQNWISYYRKKFSEAGTGTPPRSRSRSAPTGSPRGSSGAEGR